MFKGAELRERWERIYRAEERQRRKAIKRGKRLPALYGQARGDLKFRRD